MKKLFLTGLSLILASAAFISCNKDDSSSETKPEDYYVIGAGEFNRGISAPSALMSDIKSLYTAQMEKLCKTQSGCYVTDKSESEMASSFGSVEVEAQKVRDNYDWEGEITIYIKHYTGESSRVIYDKSFSKTDLSLHILNQTVEVVDSLCVGLNESKLGTLRQAINKKITSTVIGKYNVEEKFIDVSDSLLESLKVRTASFDAYQAVVVFYRQFDSIYGTTLKNYIVVSKDSSCSEITSPSAVKDIFSTTYKFECDAASGSSSIWSEFYRPEIIKFMTSAGGAMNYKLNSYCPNPLKADSTMKANMENLESRAGQWHENYCSRQCKIAVLHFDCFFDKRDSDTIYSHVFPVE